MININQLSFAYKKQPPLFQQISIEETAGKIIGLLGKNGAGKTSLLHLISGLLTPASGEISVLNHYPPKRNPNFLNQVYYVPEEFFFPNLTMEAYTNAFAPFYPTFSREKMNHLMTGFDLQPKLNLNRISLGQKKKFRIAFGLATNCPLIILDEPTNGLDIPSKGIFRKLLASSLSENQMAIISTHQVKDIETLIDKILLIDKGKIVFNSYISTISDKYEFRVTPTSLEESVYSEFSVAGYKNIVLGTGNPTEIDLELLFNAVINGANLN